MTASTSRPASSGGGRVAGKVALVTGAASGIGRATALLLAEHGAAVVCADRNGPGAEDTAAAVTAAGGQATACLLDVTSEAAWQAALAQVLQACGRLDVLVNCAGISASGPLMDLSLAVSGGPPGTCLGRARRLPERPDRAMMPPCASRKTQARRAGFR